MMRNNVCLLVLSWALVLSSACSSKPVLTAEQRELVNQYVSKSETKPEHALDVRFDDKVALLGYDLSSQEPIEPGGSVTVTWHFRVDKPVGKRWRLFTHLADGSNRSRVNLDNEGVLRGILPAHAWEAGTYIRDQQTIAIPRDWNSDKAIVYLGLWRDDERLPVKGPSDKQNRARALELKVRARPMELVELRAREVVQGKDGKPALTLDGKLDEAAWAEAQSTGPFVNTMNGEAASPNVTAKALWDANYLYIAFDVADDYLKSTFTNDDDHLWEQDTVEIMLDPDGDGKNYFELQVSPAGKVFDTRYDSRRVPKPFGHMDFNSGLKNGVSLRGKLNDDDKDEGYTVEIAIPWTAFTLGDPKHDPPKAGETWRMNLYVMDAREKGMRAVGWSPPLVGDFHVPNRFGKLVFEAREAPAPEATATPATP